MRGERGIVSATEADRIVRTVAKLNGDEHYAMGVIAEALGMSRSTLGYILRRHGGYQAVRRGSPGNTRTLARIAWRDTDSLSPVSLYQHSTTLQLVDNLLSTLRHDNAVNRLAHDARDALGENDQEWVGRATELIAEAMAYLGRLQLVLTDQHARQRAIHDPRERDDVRSSSVVVKLVRPG